MRGIAFVAVISIAMSVAACGGGPARRVVVFSNDYADRFYRSHEKDVCQSVCASAKRANERVALCYEARLDPSVSHLTPEDRKEAIVCKLE